MDRLKEALVTALTTAVTRLPDDVITALSRARDNEDSPIARQELETILKNTALARDAGLPICQDTGTPTFFVAAGADSPHLGIITPAITRAVAEATERIPLRPNTVDPFTGDNPGNNLGQGIPLIDWEVVPGDAVKIAILPKGGGSENACALRLLRPSAGIAGVKRAVVEHIAAVKGLPCPPTIVGVGIGGGADAALRLGKRALLRRVGEPHPEARVAALERELTALLNETGIGPMGLGGRATVLAVHVEYAMRHPASLPVGIVIQCWADRRAVVLLRSDGKIEVEG